jgi:nicotinamide mononucleotide (NMN) deamidase PncC
MADLVGVAGEGGKSMTGPVGAAWLTFVLDMVDKRTRYEKCTIFKEEYAEIDIDQVDAGLVYRYFLDWI